MNAAKTHTLVSAGPDRTCRIAQRLAKVFQVGDTLLLSGDIGAGKTHFARCLIQSLLIAPEDVPSPTYTLVQTYTSPRAEIWHADLYRLTDTNEVFELGLVDAFSGAICLVEWPDRLGDLVPPGALHVTMTALDDPEARRLSFDWQDAQWSTRLKEVWND
ncbi:tRNA (adenosine(37)-N6)-threonylcarbamoyltransferase complex ATPase subunit type 1 TsaE [Pelagivirga sediminicola]|uniref:tRNA threonylcarbamoyladenosine biosynthesis protein TsaE n=1 Tax=Pelagivirga sediminicola TaxID=2170575 RepID=A0A2T7G8L5_9RHOB|nr:tRNA (adenosine(37)-N6)-threonylcarbamoyltransferase complex ATPase subunit type 1 TsaE [Pelagivirga sediminicola]PVA10760.1 tRNA (adenosine(37)-N6)-threonylcarbamoyltransferase complex ATPase subunit type 1 TsaE [Pelagivirga sediminicola]